jgi:hypothetical protein
MCCVCVCVRLRSVGAPLLLFSQVRSRFSGEFLGKGRLYVRFGPWEETGRKVGEVRKVMGLDEASVVHPTACLVSLTSGVSCGTRHQGGGV